ncbi:hypothetical protein AUC43_06105 [Hymenobacter sedentarius]|uniref:Outer membrane protein beta-barrel domain-containing protein n=1 Tax=Hymenobacter sedentarius TaxID=1411621 RepID=A0A0U4BWS8_9BACT|nr:hypothetical protein [Hymenobacter sedentarius]ALW84689.1 hypothetical protein AUC43_06105 [Hymenobacter sedentarius]
MNTSLRSLCLGSALGLFGLPALAQAPAERVLVVSPTVGEVIDGGEKARFGLFPAYAADNFVEARFMRSLTPDSAITLRARLRDGRLDARPYSEAEFLAVREAIARRVQELGAQATAPAAIAAQQAPNPPVSTKAVPEIIGRTYSVELLSGSSFNGILRASNAEELEFETKDLGLVKVQRANLKRLELLTEQQAKKGFQDVGNGTRLLFAPTARNLRRGEGYVQDIEVYFIGANYGITDNISLGVLVPVIPFIAGKAFAITPKVSVPVSEKFHVGVGALYARVSVSAFGVSAGGGIGYGVGTYGTADDNVTLGVGYGFTDRGETSSSPVVVLGGAKRISNYVSLINETYIYDGGALGLVGGRFHAKRFSGSLGAAYGTNVGGIYPAYLEAAYRFGKNK